MGVDASAFGNHEFDYGLHRLMTHMQRATFPYLTVNIQEEATGQPPDWARPSEVFEVNGVRTG